MFGRAPVAYNSNTFAKLLYLPNKTKQTAQSVESYLLCRTIWTPPWVLSAWPRHPPQQWTWQLTWRILQTLGGRILNKSNTFNSISSRRSKHCFCAKMSFTDDTDWMPMLHVNWIRHQQDVRKVLCFWLWNAIYLREFYTSPNVMELYLAKRITKSG